VLFGCIWRKANISVGAKHDRNQYGIIITYMRSCFFRLQKPDAPCYSSSLGYKIKPANTSIDKNAVYQKELVQSPPAREKLKSDYSLLQSSDFLCQLSTVNCQLGSIPIVQTYPQGRSIRACILSTIREIFSANARAPTKTGCSRQLSTVN
jgi:hypothetical protein